MEAQEKKNKERNKIKVRDLKPLKDAKGGYPPDPCGPGGSRRGINLVHEGRQNHNETFLADIS